MSKINRVALVSFHYAEYVLNLALALAEKTQVLLILYQDNADNELDPGWYEAMQRPGLRLEVFSRPASIKPILKNAYRLIKTIKQFAPDVIHYQEDPRDELILSIPFLRQFPSLLTVHDPSSHTGLDAKFNRITIYRKIMRLSFDRAIVHGDLLAVELAAQHPHFKNKVFAIAHGPVGGGFDGRVAVRPAACRLLFFGRIHAYKGLSYFVDAVIALHQKGLPVLGVIAGKGSDLDQHKQRMLDAGCFEINDRYIPPEDVPGLFLDSLITVLPYTDGTQSGVAARAICCGRPVVASAVGSIPELVKEGINGLLVPPRNSEQLAQAMERIIVDAELWQTLANGALDLKYGELSWHAIAEKTLNAYADAIAGRTRQA